MRAAFGKFQTPTALAATYADAMAYHSEALSEIREATKVMKKDGDTFVAAANDFAIGYHKAALAWLKTAPAK